ncbi:MAG TPA: glycosyltransferase [Tepidisphaeraceae bacterium]|nr:glycosyltransferase [Tepidisphaeraceae bacterium]
MKELCVIGHPSTVGGADTELDHQIRCWQAMGIKVHICHTGDLTAELRAMGLERRGCVYHRPRDWASVDGLHCISYCNGEFLKALPEIKKHARSTTFVNCMTFNFDLEVQRHAEGLIDFHLYQTRHAFDRVSPKLAAATSAVYRPLFAVPYFDAEAFPFVESRPDDRFRFGRLSRHDPAKFAQGQLWIYETMTAPVPKAGLVMGWGAEVEAKFGRRPETYISVVDAGWLPQQDFYRFCDAVIMSTDTFENLPRVGMEAMAAGSVLVVDRRGGWELLVDNGVTGWLCADQREFVYRASRLAFETEERQAFRLAAREKLVSQYGFDAASKTWEEVFARWAKLH